MTSASRPRAVEPRAWSRRAGATGIAAHLRRGIAAGYRPHAASPHEIDYLAGSPGRAVEHLAGTELATRLGRTRDRGLVFIVPTVIGRVRQRDWEPWFHSLLSRVAEARDAMPDVPVTLAVGNQWPEPGQRREASAHLEIMGRTAVAAGIRFVGMALPQLGKKLTLNAGIEVGERLGARGIGWMDDDVLLAKDCLSHMATRFRAKGWRGCVGATKLASPKPYATSRLILAAKAVIEPALCYPHGCCILVEMSVVSGGIPHRYTSDDGYVCFQLLDPSLPNPLEWLELVPDARCHYHVGGPARETYRRIRRILLHHHIYLADWPIAVSRYYFRHVLFFGLWPLAPFDRSRGWWFGFRKCVLKWLYFGWFIAVGAELYARGLLSRPLRRVPWGTRAPGEWRLAAQRST